MYALRISFVKYGIPETRLEYYLQKLEKLNLSYIVYHFDSKHEQLIEKCTNDGEYHKEYRNNKNCLICKGIRCYGEDKYMNAIHKMLQGENKKNER